MDDMTRFEGRLESRVRAFARTGVTQVDAAAVAHAVAAGRLSGAGRVVRGLGLTFDRRAWTIVLALGLLVVSIGGALLVGARLSQPSPLDARPPRLAYMVDGDIYVADGDGTDPVRIVDGVDTGCGGLIVNRGLVSPDGRHLAYRSHASDRCQAWVNVTSLDGSDAYSFPGDGWNIAWSPDSSRVATWLELGSTIGVYRRDGVLEATLDGARGCCGDHDPAWAPDGASLELPLRESVLRIPIDGSPPGPVPTTDPRSRRFAVWSPDGRRAAFIIPWVEVDNGPQLAGQPLDLKDLIVVIDADGSNQRTIAEIDVGLDRRLGSDGRALAWSPAGDRIAYAVNYETDQGSDGAATWRSELWVVDPTAGAPSMLATDQGAGPIRPIGFSPTGDRLVFARSDERGVTSIWSVDRDGSSAATQIAGIEVPATGHLEILGATPDGGQVLVGVTLDPAGDPASNRSVWSVDTAGASARMLVAGTEYGEWVRPQ